MRRSVSLAALCLAACGSEPARERAAPVPTPSPFASPSPKPIPAATPALTAEGWGPIRVGMTLAAVEAALGRDADAQAVGGADPAACDVFRPARAPDGLLVMVEEGRVARVSLVRPARVATDRGIRVGDRAEAVTLAYGAAVEATPHKYEEPPAAYLMVRAKGKGGTPSSRGMVYEVGRDGRVSAVHAGGPAIAYVEGCS